ncbi:hypothetical protein evm_013481 [Chilo suppressalis]|nr:hypothetical protein evm_013481 [Chilo suppressalis]
MLICNLNVFPRNFLLCSHHKVIRDTYFSTALLPFLKPNCCSGGDIGAYLSKKDDIQSSFLEGFLQQHA